MGNEKKGMKALELWCRQITLGYKDVYICNMTTSFRDGLAFCALVHHYRPDLLDFESLCKENIFYNNNLAFSVAEQKLGIPALLDAEDMVQCEVPDRLSIMTYVSQFYNYFEGIPAKSPMKKAFKEQHGEQILVGPTEKVPAMKITPSTMHIGKRLEKCALCKNRVYILERLLVESKLYHRTCFRCIKCKALLKPGCYVEGDEKDTYECVICPHEEKAGFDFSIKTLKREQVDLENQPEKEHNERSSIEKSDDSKSEDICEHDKEGAFKDENDAIESHSSQKSGSISSANIDNVYEMTADKILEGLNEVDNEESSESEDCFDSSSDSELDDQEEQSFSENRTADEIDVSNEDDAKSDHQTHAETSVESEQHVESSDIKLEESSEIVKDEDLSVDLATKENEPDSKDVQKSSELTKLEVTNEDDEIKSSENIIEIVKDEDLSVDEATKENEPDSKDVQKSSELTNEDDEIKSSENKIDEIISQDDDIIDEDQSSENIVDKIISQDNDIVDEDQTLKTQEDEISISKHSGESQKPLDSLNQDDTSNIEVNSSVESTPRKKPALPKKPDFLLKSFSKSSESSAESVSNDEPENISVKKSKSLNPFDSDDDEEIVASENKDHQKPISYPKDSNPFGDDEDEEDKIVKKEVLNPFGDSDEENAPQCEKTNPFEDSDDEDIPANKSQDISENVDWIQSVFGTSTLKSSQHLDTSTAPVPKPRKLKSPATTSPARVSPGTLSGRKKKRAPLPPGPASPLLRKSPAPSPPPRPSRTKSINLSNANDMKPIKKFEEDVNVMDSSKKLTFGYWKKKKKAPPIPGPIKRQITKISMKEIQQELAEIEEKQLEYELSGVEIEKSIRDMAENETSTPEEEDLVLQLFDLVNEKNKLFRRQADLMYLKRQHRLEEEYVELEYQIRLLMQRPAHLKTDSEKTKEEELIAHLMEVVEMRNDIVESQDRDRRRIEAEETGITEELANVQKTESLNSNQSLEKKKKKKEKKAKKSKKDDKDPDKKKVLKGLKKIKFHSSSKQEKEKKAISES